MTVQITTVPNNGFLASYLNCMRPKVYGKVFWWWYVCYLRLIGLLAFHSWNFFPFWQNSDSRSSNRRPPFQCSDPKNLLLTIMRSCHQSRPPTFDKCCLIFLQNWSQTNQINLSDFSFWIFAYINFKRATNVKFFKVKLLLTNRELLFEF